MPEPALAAMDDAIFVALADPTRRRLLDRLGDGGAVTASVLASELPISRQAVSKHLDTLAGARLVAARRVGRETRYTLTPAPLGDLAAVLEAVGAAWETRLGRLRDLVEATAGDDLEE